MNRSCNFPYKMNYMQSGEITENLEGTPYGIQYFIKGRKGVENENSIEKLIIVSNISHSAAGRFHMREPIPSAGCSCLSAS